MTALNTIRFGHYGMHPQPLPGDTRHHYDNGPEPKEKRTPADRKADWKVIGAVTGFVTMLAVSGWQRLMKAVSPKTGGTFDPGSITRHRHDD